MFSEQCFFRKDMKVPINFQRKNTHFNVLLLSDNIRNKKK